MYYVDKDFLGTQHHLFANQQDTESVEGLLCENGTADPGTMSSFLKIMEKSCDLIPQEVRMSLDTCGIPVNMAGLSHVLRSSELAQLLADFKQNSMALVNPMAEYVPHYINNVQTLNSCKQMVFEESFCNPKIDSSGLAERVVYDTTSTKTGRMSVVSGLNVLTLEKGFKSKLKSRYESGKIVEIDYSALEPRVALAVSESPLALVDDVYAEIGKMIGMNDRGTVKQLIISFLYGAGNATMQRLTNLPAKDLSDRLKIMSKLFKRAEIVRSLRVQLAKGGWFLNQAGRPVFPGSEKEGLLFNNYCQSSAVDVALSGFSALLQRIRTEEMKSIPLCFIHDAILLDVPEEEIENLGKFSAKLHTYMGIEFPTKLTVIK